MLGLAVGGIGMSYEDFCRLTLEEFSRVYEAYSDKSEGLYRDNWERMRMQAFIIVRPFVRNKLTLRKFLSLPWDYNNKNDAVVLPKDEARKCFESLVRKQGAKNRGATSAGRPL
jgi:hypothetical protein